MTEKLFYENAYLKEFHAAVKRCVSAKKGKKEVFHVILDRTAFFPEGGGQYADTGILGGRKVLDVQEIDEGILHITDGPLTEGDTVEGCLDWTERHMKMQQHTGEHIVSGIVNRRFGYQNVGFHLGSEDCTMDFNGEITKEQLREIETEANRAVAANCEVLILFPKPEELETLQYRSKIEIEGQVRIVAIPGYDVCACCAPHVYRTGEIGMIKLTNVQHYKGGVRVTLLCGARALADYRDKEQQIKEASALLCAPEQEVYQAVVRLKEEKDGLKQQLWELKHQLLREKLFPYLEWERKGEKAPEFLWISEKDLTPEDNKYLLNQMLEKGVGICIVVSENAEQFRYIAGSRTQDVRPVAKWFNIHFEGRGGGKEDMVQGACSLRPEEGTLSTIFETE